VRRRRRADPFDGVRFGGVVAGEFLGVRHRERACCPGCSHAR
jgi:hypothetical protein